MNTSNSASQQQSLRARHDAGNTPVMQDWYLKSETGELKDVLLGPAESFRWLGEENAEWSSLVRESLRKGRVFDEKLARSQHAEMISAYEDAGTQCHFLPVDMHTPYQVYARDSSFMSPYGAVLCQMASPRRRGEYAPALRFYLETIFPFMTWSLPAILKAGISILSSRVLHSLAIPISAVNALPQSR